MQLGLCAYCRKFFTPNRHHKRYCSDLCASKARKAQVRFNTQQYRLNQTQNSHEELCKGVLRACGYCDSPFMCDKYHRRYCCDECAEAARREQVCVNMSHYRSRWRHLKRYRNGTGRLGSHMSEDFETEQREIYREFRLLNLKQKH